MYNCYNKIEFYLKGDNMIQFITAILGGLLGSVATIIVTSFRERRKIYIDKLENFSNFFTETNIIIWKILYTKNSLELQEAFRTIAQIKLNLSHLELMKKVYLKTNEENFDLFVSKVKKLIKEIEDLYTNSNLKLVTPVNFKAESDPNFKVFQNNIFLKEEFSESTFKNIIDLINKDIEENMTSRLNKIL